MTAPPAHVMAAAARLRELHPGARIETECRWFVRALRPIPTSNIGHELCIDVRNIPAEAPDPPPEDD